MDAPKVLFTFPKWTNRVRPLVLGVAIATPLYGVLLFAYGASPQTTDVGYAPVQPVAYSHAMHAGQLAIDCRYCHNTVEDAATAAVPPTQTCMNCHAKIRASSSKMLPVQESYATGDPIPWLRVHDLPDYVYFNHSAHVRRGVSCVSCHGRVDTMEVVTQVEKLSMGWCIVCHRHPERHLRPVEYVTQLAWVPNEDQLTMGLRLKKEYNIRGERYLTDCSICHR